MAEARDSEDSRRSFQMALPTAFGEEVTLSPHGTATIRFSGDVDMVLHAITADAIGPAVVRFRIDEAPSTGTPVAQIPGGTFQEYLERELPGHLAALVGEDGIQWARKNGELLAAAQAGDDEAFFELLARDPRWLASELTLQRALTWRTWIDTYNRFFRFKPSRFLASNDAVARARDQMEQARRNLVRLGESQLWLYDQRGKRPLPPAALVRGIYYGLLCLLKGLRTVYAAREKAGAQPRELEAHLSAFVAGLPGLRGESPLLPYVGFAVQLIRDPEILERAGLTDVVLSELVQPRHGTPSETAQAITAAAFDVSEDTAERLASKPAPIPLPSASADENCFLVGPPTFDLLEFPEVKELLASLTR